MTLLTKSSEPARAVHSGSLDGWRGILASIVCFDHAWGVFVEPIEAHANRNWFEAITFFLTRAAVLCFFALSGFVMALSVQKSIARHGRFLLWSYCRSRLLRILPPLLLVFLMGWLLEDILASMHLLVFPRTDIQLARSNFQFNAWNQISALFSLGLHGDLTGGINGPLWSLRYEIQCYVLCGLGSYIVFSKAAWWKRLFILWVLHYFSHRLHFTLGVGMVCFSTFLAGWLVYWNQYRLNWRVIGGVGLIFAVLWLTALRLTNLQTLNPFDGLDDNCWMLLNQLGVGGLGALSLVLIQRSRWVARFKKLGDFSYTLYIAHFPILLFAAFLLYTYAPTLSVGAGIVICFVMIGLSLGLSFLLALIGERPAALRYKDNFITQIWDKISSGKTESL